MASSTTTLIGPPSLSAVSAVTTVKPLAEERPKMGLTENLSPTFLSSGNPCLDFFFHVVPDTPPQDLIQRLSMSWSHDPLTTLKLICNLRGVRGTGKSDKEGFYTAAYWLHQNHPITLALNLSALVDFGYFKDLPEILYRILEGQVIERGKKRTRRNKIQSTKLFKRNRRSCFSGESEDPILENVEQIVCPVDKTKARALRKQREFEKAKKAIGRGTGKSDKEGFYIAAYWLHQNHPITLALNLSALVDFGYFKDLPEILYRILEGQVEERSPRAAAKSPRASRGVYMSAKKWDSLNYSRVASVAMKNYTKVFAEHDSERFRNFLKDVKSGEKKIAAGALLPHEIIKQLRYHHDDAVSS
ncbi:unnamed protein product [Cochlearia groenlandica]